MKAKIFLLLIILPLYIASMEKQNLSEFFKLIPNKPRYQIFGTVLKHCINSDIQTGNPRKSIIALMRTNKNFNEILTEPGMLKIIKEYITLAQAHKTLCKAAKKIEAFFVREDALALSKSYLQALISNKEFEFEILQRPSLRAALLTDQEIAKHFAKDSYNLTHICSLNDIHSARILLAAGADPNKCKLTEETPLMWAMHHQNNDMANLILEYENQCNNKDEIPRNTYLMAQKFSQHFSISEVMDIDRSFYSLVVQAANHP